MVLYIESFQKYTIIHKFEQNETSVQCSFYQLQWQDTLLLYNVYDCQISNCTIKEMQA